MRPLTKRLILEPTDHDFDCNGAFNPACVRSGDDVHVIYRASDRDHRGTLGYARLDLAHNTLERSSTPVLAPSEEYDSFGTEDPKLIPWEGGSLLLYHAVGTRGPWTGVGTAAAYSEDFRGFAKLGLVRPFTPLVEALPKTTGAVRRRLLKLHGEYSGQPHVRTLWGKDVVLFPEKFNGAHLAVYRMPPLIAIAPLPSLSNPERFWTSALLDSSRTLLSPQHRFESRSISPSAPPVLTKHGWLLVFHCVDTAPDGNARYTASAALLDRANPSRVLARLATPLLEPEQRWERTGLTGNCVYVSSAEIRGDRLLVYYGAADVRSAVAEYVLDDVVNAMR